MTFNGRESKTLRMRRRRRRTVRCGVFVSFDGRGRLGKIGAPKEEEREVV